MSGLIYLNSVGLMNAWITGDPDFSHYLSIFKRYTDFSFETIEKTFQGDIAFDSIITCDIPTDEADVVTNLTLSLELAHDLNETLLFNAYTFNVGTRIIEYAELIMGGQVIEKITGDYINIHQILYNTPEIRDAYNNLTVLTGYNSFPSYGLYNRNIKFMVDLPFYFYRNTRLSIPICALNKHNIQIRIKLGGKRDVYVFYNSQLPDTKNVINASLLVRYGFLSKPETDFMKSVQLNHVITQLQYSRIKIKHDAGNNPKRMLLNFKHPVKELYFFNKGDSLGVGDIPIKRATFKINGEILFDEDGLYLMYLQPYYNHKRIADVGIGSVSPNVCMYSFALEPQNPEPTGQINMSRIIHKEFIVEFDDTDFTWIYAPESSFEIYAISYNILTFENGFCGLKYM